MPTTCSALRVDDLGGCTRPEHRGPVAASLRVFSASPETHRRLSPELRGGILQAPWPNHAPQPTPWIAPAFPSPLVRRG